MIRNSYPKRIVLIAILSIITVFFTGTVIAAPFAYISNRNSQNVSVIDTATNTVVNTITVGNGPYGVAANLAGTRVYVACFGSNAVSVIDPSTDTVMTDISLGSGNVPVGVAVNQAGTRVYVTNSVANTVSVIDTGDNTVIATVTVGASPYGVVVNPSGTRVYVANLDTNFVSVIDTNTNTVIATVTVGTGPFGVAVSRSSKKVYSANKYSDNVSVIDTDTNTIITTIQVGKAPHGIALNPAGTRAYVANRDDNSVSVIDTSTDTVTDTIPVGNTLLGIGTNPEGTRVYVANFGSNTVSVIDTSSNSVLPDDIPVGTGPVALGQFIGPAIFPGEGTVGTEITIPGSGFGSKKGKVLVGNVTPKILEWTDSSIQCQILKSPPPGTYDVAIQPKGASPIVVPNGLTIVAPEIDSVEPSSGSANDQVTVSGLFFGTKKGKVTLGGKTCKVSGWTMDSKTGDSRIEFVVPKGLTPGAQELKVANGVGTDTVNFTVD